MTNNGRHLVIVGADAPADDTKSPWWVVGIVCAIAVGIYALSPGALHFYKHGRLPR